MNSIPNRYKSDHLFLLVGTNPLPNYVAAQLLLRTRGTVHLLYSQEGDISSTLYVARLLQQQLENLSFVVERHEIHEADERTIRTRVKDILASVPRDLDIGLNYTGGTKPMAVHAYRALSANKKRDNPVFSYLDARRLALFFDGSDIHYPVARNIEVNFSDLATLHGYEIRQQLQQEVVALEVAQALATVHSSEQGYNEWRKWCRSNPSDFPDPASSPSLAPVRAAMDSIAGSPQAFADLFFPGQRKTFKSCADWLQGKWLEVWALHAIVRNASLLHITQYGANVELAPTPAALPKGSSDAKKFELDAAAILGYQLFVVSCKASKSIGGSTKLGLLEAFVRARQLGGDEARVALVSAVATPDRLQREVERAWDAAGRVRVFGRDHLAQLPNYFNQWFRQAGGTP